MDEYMQYAGVAETIGVRVEKLTPDEVIDIWPLAVKDGLVRAIATLMMAISSQQDLTQALAKGARDRGAGNLS